VFIYVHSKREQKVISNYQIYSVAISILRVAIISNVQNIRLQHRHKPTKTDDDSTRRWRGSQQTGPVRTTRRSDALCSSSTSLTVLWYICCMPCFVQCSAVQKLLKSVKIWQSCSQIHTATFYEPRQKCRFTFFQLRCAHKSGDVINFVTVACRISSG